MKLKQSLTSIADGVIQGFCVTKVLLGITFSQFASETPMENHLIIACIVALLTAIVYFLLMHKEQNNKKVLKITAISFLCFIVSSPIFIALPFSIFPQREIGDAEGIGLMLVLASFFITAFVVRLGILIGICVRNKRKT